MSTKRSRSMLAFGQQGIVAVGILCTALASGVATAQTAFGGASTIVFPLVSQTQSFMAQVTLYNPNAADITANLSYFDADNVLSPGAHVCSDVTIPANQSVQFFLPEKCDLDSNSHFGVLAVSDSAATNPMFGYARTENTAGAGFSVEGFPVDNFTSDVAYAIGLRQTASLPGYQTNCFVAGLDGQVTYDLQLMDGSTGAQLGSTLSGVMNPFEQFRYLDVFALAGVLPGDYSNVRAQFTRTGGAGQKLIGFCTVQDNISFGADFRIAKSVAPAPPVNPGPSTANWQGTMLSIGSNQNAYAFAGPTATATLASGSLVSASGSAAIAINSGTKSISLNVCYQNQNGPGPIAPIGDAVAVTATTTLTTYFVAGSASLAAGIYNVGLCAVNPGNGPVNKNGNTVGVVVVTPWS